MALYRLYAGMSGGFGGANYMCTEEFENETEAMKAAEELAREEYQSYESMGGIQSWTDCAKEVLADNGIIEDAEDFDGDVDELLDDDLRELVQDAYEQAVEGWISYYVKPADSDTDPEEEEEDF